MDITHGTPENPVTTYHKTETLRLIREAITNSDHSSLPTSVVAATLHLLYFAVSNALMQKYNDESIPEISKHRN
jgi:hypothetical protein